MKEVVLSCIICSDYMSQLPHDVAFDVQDGHIIPQMSEATADLHHGGGDGAHSRPLTSRSATENHATGGYVVLCWA
jgi:hypothetical protein